MKHGIKQLIGTLTLLLLGCGLAFGQANVCINGSGGSCSGPYTGNAITTTGYNLSSGTLFGAPNAALQFGLPFTIVYGIKTNTTLGTTTQPLIDNRGGVSTTGHGFYSFNFVGSTGFPFQTSIANSSTTNCPHPQAALCTRNDYVNDGNWHEVCATFTSSGATFYIDGVIRDVNTQAITYVAPTSYWNLGSGSNLSVQLRDAAAYARALTAPECALASARAQSGFDLASGNAGTLASGLAALWHLGNCTGSGATFSCPESSGSGAPALILDSGGSTVVTITSPSGTVSGSVNLQATCTDPIACKNVQWTFDGAPVGTVTTAPYTVAINTANYVDGVHVVGASATNVGGFVTAATPVNITTNNGVSAKSVFISGAGSDSNNCLTTGTACATMQKANSFTYHGGDSILFDVAHPISVSSITIGATNSTALILAGPNSVIGNSNTVVTQNAFGVGSGYQLTVGTYNGSGSCSPLGGVSTNCATITLSGNSITAGAPMVAATNLSYVTIQNLKVDGTGQTQAGTQGVGIEFSSTSGTNGVGVLIQNNEVINFEVGIFDSAIANLNNDFGHFGNPCGATIQDNYNHNPLVTTPSGGGLYLLNVANCTASGGIGVTAVSNYVANISGVPATGAGVGSGIALINGGFGQIDNFNVSGNGGYGNSNCGGGYGNWWYQQHNVIAKGNEVYGWGPQPNNPLGNGCDNGAFDIDHDNSFITVEYNYGHTNWGPAMAVLDIDDGNGVNAVGGNIIRYNIFENSGLQTHDQTGGMMGGDWSAARAAGPDQVYNNTIWNGKNGVPDPFATGFTTQVAAISMAPTFAPPSGMVIANNIMVANSANGGAIAEYVTYSSFGPGNLNSLVNWRNNAYFNIGTNSTQEWRDVNGGPGGISGTNYTTLTTWSAGVGATGEIVSTPNLASPGGGQAVVCYTLGTGNPNPPCTTSTLPGYQLTNPGSSAFIGTGLDINAAFGLVVGTVDFYGNTLGNGVGTGFNIGADGAHH